MTKTECAIVTAYTDCAMVQGHDLKYLYEYLGEVTGRTVWAHEIPAVCERYRGRIKQDFVRLCAEAEDD